MSKNLALAQSLGADFKVRADAISANLNDTFDASLWSGATDGQKLIKTDPNVYMAHKVSGFAGDTVFYGPGTGHEFEINQDLTPILKQVNMDSTNYPTFHSTYGLEGGILSAINSMYSPTFVSGLPYSNNIRLSINDPSSLVMGQSGAGTGNDQYDGGWYIGISPTELPDVGGMGYAQLESWPQDAYLLKVAVGSGTMGNTVQQWQGLYIQRIQGPTDNLAPTEAYIYVVQAQASMSGSADWEPTTAGANLGSFADQTYLDTAINNLKGSAPASMDTLKELSDAVIASPVGMWNAYKQFHSFNGSPYNIHTGDGATTTFAFPHRPGMIDVWVNGILQTPRISSVDNFSATPMEVLGSGYDYSSQVTTSVTPALTFDNENRGLPQGLSSYWAEFMGDNQLNLNVSGLMQSFTALNWDGSEAIPSENAGPGYSFPFPESEDSKITLVEQSSNIVMYGYLRGVAPVNVGNSEYGQIYITPGNGDTFADWDYLFSDTPFSMAGAPLQVTINAYAGWTTGGTTTADVNDDQVHGLATSIAFVNPPENGASIEIRFW